MTDLNFWRQLDVFDPATFQKEVHVVGCGAIGSHLIDSLVRSGILRITVYDHDSVEDHNLPNQIFTLDHVGKPKVDSICEVVSRVGAKLTTVQEKVEALDISTSAYVFLAVDSMSARKTIFDSILYNPGVRLIEARMDAEFGFIHCINPSDIDDINFWESRWFPDEDAEESACTNRAVCTTAKVMASMMTHALISWERGQKPPRAFSVCMRPPMVSIEQE